MMYLFFREPTGKILKVPNNYSVADITKFGTNVVAKGKAILSKYRGGYKATGTLLNNYSFSSKFTKNGAVISLNFGAAGLYWRFINEGVRGAGGHTGSGRLRGVGSKFSFKPNGKMPPTNAIKRWITVKGISPKTGQTIDSMAYGMATEIKRRGLYRTQFVDKPIKSEYKKIPDTLVEAMAIDIDTLLEKLPDPIMRVDLERTNFTTG
tara:strand:+ start:7433 stop:8056 length:624 start_codon:yes stop_codon:yes gene_type:complete